MNTARALPAALLLLLLVSLTGPAAANGQDPSLEQRLDAGQKIVTGEKTLSAGHVDVGPRFVEGRWTLMIHDDAAKAGAGGESVWRHTERTVLRVTDDAVLEAPDDPVYAFLHAEPGADLYVVPQTQDPDVVWVGWNTQDPEVMERIDRGVTMKLTGVQGPGSLIVYLQSADFAEPKVLWDSTAKSEPVWVDVNTHTHANWVFSRPGAYLARIEISAELIDGSKVTDTRELRFAVGSRTSTEDALAASWRGVAAAAPAASTPASGDAARAGRDPLVAVLIAVLAIGLTGGIVAVGVRGGRAKRRARSAEAQRPGGA